ncbi:MAG: 6-phosphogluconolactonase [Anaerolineales bacterium]|nr:6-phosphogluconolactonase [Anaerolineales bacterium]MCX7756586.1 6-phosphogluconolactonase [Anaerolineales bacterium]MDW8277844.1 6-phosphogluconolactonase [Anaerolineales bacterium]
MQPVLEIFPNPPALVNYAANLFAQMAAAAPERFSVALSGGSTPRALYERLATNEMAKRIPWEKVHLFWGDERCVPPDHPESNYGLTAAALLSRIPLPAENVHRVRGELPPAEAASLYEAELRAFFGETPAFDLVFLGMGEDGHTASLFPGSPALAESVRWAVEVEHTAPPPPLVSRVTLTFQVLNAARQVVFLVTGAAKAGMFAQVWHGASFPAAQIRPRDGELLWLVDQAAASEL